MLHIAGWQTEQHLHNSFIRILPSNNIKRILFSGASQSTFWEALNRAWMIIILSRPWQRLRPVCPLHWPPPALKLYSGCWGQEKVLTRPKIPISCSSIFGRKCSTHIETMMWTPNDLYIPDQRGQIIFGEDTHSSSPRCCTCETYRRSGLSSERLTFAPPQRL